jgi:hypothetical protein
MNKLYLMRLYLFNDELVAWDDSYIVSNRKTEYIWTWTLPNVFLSKVDDVADGNLNQAAEGWLHLVDVLWRTPAFVKQ